MKHRSNVIISRNGKTYFSFDVLQFLGVEQGEEICLSKQDENVFIELSFQKKRGSIVHVEQRGIETRFFIRSNKFARNSDCRFILKTQPLRVGGEWGSLLYKLVEA